MTSSQRNRIRRLKILVIVVMTIATTVIALSWQHWWWRIYGTVITINGRLSARSAVYAQGSRRMVSIPEYDSVDGIGYLVCYIISPKASNVGVSGGISVLRLDSETISLSFYVSPIFAFSRLTDPSSVEMGTAKIEMAPRIHIYGRNLEFSDAFGSRVHVGGYR